MNDEFFSDDVLRAATRLVRQSMLDALPSPSECPAAFSPEFHKRITILFARQRHKAMARRIVQRAAVLLLSALIGLSAWLTVDVEAREALFGWLREMYENSIIYRFDNSSSANTAHTRYYIANLPSSYTETMSADYENDGYVLYANSMGQYLSLHYLFGSDKSAFLVGKENVIISNAVVNGSPADLLISKDPAIASAIVWADKDGPAFCISAFMNPDDLIALAESVKPSK